MIMQSLKKICKDMKYYVCDIDANATNPDWYNLDYKVNKGVNQYSLQFEKLPDYNPVFVPLILDFNKRITDFILVASAICGIGFIINERVKDILLKYNVLNYRLYDLEVLQKVKGSALGIKNENLPKFFYLQIVTCDFKNWIDFNKSELHVETYNGELVESPKLSNYEMLEYVFKNLKFKQRIKFTYLCLNNEFKNKEVDMFFINEIVSRKYSEVMISDRLKERFEKEKITGLADYISLNIEV